MLRIMTGPATHANVFAIQDKASLRVIEALGRWIPVDHLKINAVVIGVALYAGFALGSAARKRGMQSSVLLYFSGDFLMTLEAVKDWRFSRYRMALCAVCVAPQTLMRMGQRSR
jgi:hypothetical protein